LGKLTLLAFSTGGNIPSRPTEWFPEYFIAPVFVSYSALSADAELKAPAIHEHDTKESRRRDEGGAGEELDKICLTTQGCTPRNKDPNPIGREWRCKNKTGLNRSGKRGANQLSGKEKAIDKIVATATYNARYMHTIETGLLLQTAME
jgi:hypothetical protein